MWFINMNSFGPKLLVEMKRNETHLEKQMPACINTTILVYMVLFPAGISFDSMSSPKFFSAKWANNPIFLKPLLGNFLILEIKVHQQIRFLIH